ncbi:MAG: Rne/Rng family ribonuclease [Pseudomonadota bacterium]
MPKKMLIDATHPEETRVVVVDGNKVEDFDFESINKRQLAGNIYLAKVTRVEPSLQAAFVEYGGNRHGFLAFPEIHPDYYQIPMADREALLAEEEREARADAAAEDDEAEKASKRGRRSRKSKEREKPAAKSEAEAAEPTTEKPEKRRSRRGKRSGRAEAGVAGLEVIDLDSGAAVSAEVETTVPKGLEIAGEPAETADAPVSAEAEAEIAAPEPVASTRVVEPVAPTVEAVEDNAPAAATDPEDPELAAAPAEADDAVPETAKDEVAAEAAPETDDAVPQGDATPDPDDTPPTSGSMAEASGLEDESISEDVAVVEADNASTQPDSEPAKEPRKTRVRSAKPRRSRKAKAPAEEEEATEADSVSEEPEIEQSGADDPREEIQDRERAIRRRRYKIQDVIKVRQIMLVQVVKEERGNKGAALTTYLSLAGRYCVLMPNTARGGGISRKITNAADRKRLREVVDGLDVPKGMGLIVRTAGAERTKPEIKRDYEFLLRQWEQIRELTLKSIAPCLIYEEGSLIKRSIRDIYSKDIEVVQVEGDAGYREAKDYMKMLTPSHAKNVKQYAEQVPLFIRYQVESYLNGMFSPVVQLRSGGYIVIGITEALVAIDVNSGRSTKEGSVEDTALKTNLEAADEVARQLRLRDLAGLIVIDFIDMDENRNNRAVEKRMKERLKTDRARIQLGRISGFGLMEMSRQRLRPGMLEASTKPCPHCHGTGMIRSDDSLALAILREVEEEAVRGRLSEVTVTAPVDIANFMINAKRSHIARIEERHSIQVQVRGDPGMINPEYRLDRVKAQARDGDRDAGGAVITASRSMASPEPVEEVEAHPPPRSRTAPDDAADAAKGEDGSKRRRRGKRGGRRRRGRGEDGAMPDAMETEDSTVENEPAADEDKASESVPEAMAVIEDVAPAELADETVSTQTAPAEPVAPTPAKDELAERTPADDTADAPAKPARAPRKRRTTKAKPKPEFAKVEPAPDEAAAAADPEAQEPESTAADGPTTDPQSDEVAPDAQVEAAVAAPLLEPEPEPDSDPDKPKRRGWWSFGF